MPNYTDMLFLVLGEFFFGEHIAETNDGIHGRSDFMTHVSQKLTFGNVSHNRLFLQFICAVNSGFELAIDLPYFQLGLFSSSPGQRDLLRTLFALLYLSLQRAVTFCKFLFDSMHVDIEEQKQDHSNQCEKPGKSS